MRHYIFPDKDPENEEEKIGMWFSIFYKNDPDSSLKQVIEKDIMNKVCEKNMSKYKKLTKLISEFVDMYDYFTYLDG